MVTENLKKKVLSALADRRAMWDGSDAKFATSMGISSSSYSRIKSGEIERILSDSAWITLARKLDVTPGDAPEWKTANTPVFQYITAQLEVCQRESMCALLCDASDIGKTYTARIYCKTHRNAVYVDCSQVKSKQKMIRFIARSYGLTNTGRYADVYADLVYYIKTIQNPIIVLDEAGDLQYEAFLEIKALWNATEQACGWYMMGADGLKEKIRRAIDSKKVGYTEIFSRFGKRYQRVLPNGGDEAQQMMRATAKMIIEANNRTETDNRVVLNKTIGEDKMPSLRRIYNELKK